MLIWTILVKDHRVRDACPKNTKTHVSHFDWIPLLARSAVSMQVATIPCAFLAVLSTHNALHEFLENGQHVCMIFQSPLCLLATCFNATFLANLGWLFIWRKYRFVACCHSEDHPTLNKNQTQNVEKDLKLVLGISSPIGNENCTRHGFES